MNVPLETTVVKLPELGQDGWVVEGLVTTLDATGSVNVAPMGPIVDASWDRLVLRPFPGSRTYDNLLSQREGVFHVTDDVRLIAASAIGVPDPFPAAEPCSSVRGVVLRDACRWYAFRIETLEHGEPRGRWTARVVDRGVHREFLGFNRAKHAVIEAAILATRRGLVSSESVSAELERLAPLVRKTGAAAELEAFDLICEFLRNPSP